MLSSVGIQIQRCSGNPCLIPAKTSENIIFPNPKKPSICSYPKKQNVKPMGIWASESANEPMGIWASESANEPMGIWASESANEQKMKMKVAVKAMERPRLVLKFIWMEKNIGIAIDQVIPGGRGTIPVSPYYFWPRKDAWEELKIMLESKPWISDKQMVLLLNQATDIINLWQQSMIS